MTLPRRAGLLLMAGLLGMPALARADEAATIPLEYQCGSGAQLSLALDRASDVVYGAILGRPVLLEHVISGSGARYAERDAADRGGRYELWMKGDSAMLNWADDKASITLLSDCALVKHPE